MANGGYDYKLIMMHPQLLSAYSGWISQKICYLTVKAILGDQIGIWQQADLEVNRLLLLFAEAERASLITRDWRNGPLWPKLSRDYGDGGWWFGEEGVTDRYPPEKEQDIRDSFLENAFTGNHGTLFPRLSPGEPSIQRLGRGPLAALGGVVGWLGRKLGNLGVCRAGIALSGIFYRLGPALTPGFISTTLKDLAAQNVSDLAAENRFRESLEMVKLLDDRTYEVGPRSSPAPSPPFTTGDRDPAQQAPERVDFNAMRALDENDRALALACVFDHFGVPVPPVQFEEIQAAHLPGLRNELLVSGTAAGRSTSRGEEQDQEGRYVFRLEGDIWHIRFEDEEGRYRNRLGLSYIHELLRHYLDTSGDGRQIPALDLMRAVQVPDVSPGALRSVVGYEEEAMEGCYGSSEEDSTDRTFDEQGARELEKAIKERGENIAKSQREIEKSHSEFEQERIRRDELEPEVAKLRELMAHKQTGTGIRGRARRLGSTTPEKARQSIRQAIKTACDHLADGSKPMKKLVEHLKKSIPDASENSFIYSPDTERDWRLE